ncbi:MAG: hypothetical protein NTY13_04620 [Chlamydiae bacterium]|nr:hypothetical protein [Chlamydiota bacterium]
MKDPKRIAIVRRNGYGDLVCIAPLVACISERFPMAEITLFVEERNKALVPYLFPKHKYVSFGSGSEYLETLKTALKQSPFDLVISSKPSPFKLNNIFLGFLKSPNKMAVTQGKGWHESFITTKRPYIQEGHQALRCLQIFDPTIKAIDPAWLPRCIVKPLALNLPHPILFFSLINNREASQLTLERFAAIANKIHRKRPFSVVLSAPLQTVFSHRLEMPTHLISLSSFEGFISLLAAVDIVLSGDGGPCHIAAALQKPQIALFGKTLPEQCSPLSPHATTLYDPINVNNIDLALIENALESALTKISV